MAAFSPDLYNKIKSLNDDLDSRSREDDFTAPAPYGTPNSYYAGEFTNAIKKALDAYHTNGDPSVLTSLSSATISLVASLQALTPNPYCGSLAAVIIPWAQAFQKYISTLASPDPGFVPD